MSIEKMIAEHPDVARSGYVNESLGRVVKHAMYCAAICNSCADACLAEPMDMRECIRLCLDCSDVCEAAYRVATRRTGSNRQLIRTMLAACIHACELCEAEASRHDNDHCRRSARMCRECADDCRAALQTLNDEVHAEGEKSASEHDAA